MTIAFWSSVKQSGVTATLASVCVIWTELYGECVNVTANHLSNDGILECLQGELKRENRERKSFCYHFGEPEFFRRIKMKQGAAEYLMKRGIRYLPMNGKGETDYFKGCGLSGVMERVPPGEFLMVDVAAGWNSGSMQILNSVDYQVCILPKDKETTDQFFLLETWNMEKCFFILPRGSISSGYSRDQFCEKYGISKDRVSEVLYNEAFELSVWEGQLVPYLRSHIGCVGEDEWELPKEEWVRTLIETAVMLRRFAENPG